MQTIPDQMTKQRIRLLPDGDEKIARGDVWSRRVVRGLLGRIRHGHLALTERFDDGDTTHTVYGADAAAELAAAIVVHDRRAYSAIVHEGSIGLGRGFIEGWWSSDDPVAVVRVLIRNMGPIDRFRNQLHRRTGWLTDRIRWMRPRDSREQNHEDISAHYDIGNEFFALFLDETMAYSSAIFPTADTPLVDASRHKFDRLLKKLGVNADHHLLEIGTGWGGMAVQAASTTGCQVTTTTISAAQFDEASRRVTEAGLGDRVSLLKDDWRDLPDRIGDNRADRLVSVEMIEAVDWRDYDDFFATIERCVTDDGVVAIQAICVPDDRWERTKHTEDFIRRFVFPNGYLPSVAAIERSVSKSTSLRVSEVEYFGADYAETLRRWTERFEANLDQVRALGLDDRFCRLWRFYLGYCEAAFLEEHVTVAHITLSPAARS